MVETKNVNKPDQLINQEVNHINFNQDHTLCSVAIGYYFYIYNISPFLLHLKRCPGFQVLFTQLVGATNLILLATKTTIQYSDDTILVWDDRVQQVVKQIKVNERIKGLSVSYGLIIVPDSKGIACFSIQSTNNTYIPTADNPSCIYSVTYVQGLGIASLHSDQKSVKITWFTDYEKVNKSKESLNSSYLAKSNEINKSLIYKWEDSGRWSSYEVTFQANDSGIQQIQFACDGSLLAVASVKGTLIRLFNPKNGSKIREFRRGVNPSQIQNLSIDISNTYLVCSSDRQTIHVYRINEDNTKSYFSNFSYLIPMAADQWSFAQINVPYDLNNHIFKLCVKNDNIYLFGHSKQFFQFSSISQGGQIKQTYCEQMEIYQ